VSALRIPYVRLRGIASAVPEAVVALEDLQLKFGTEDAKKVADSTGFQTRSVSSQLCASDMCLAAAERLLQALGWEPESVDVLIFVSQTPDYLLPATSAVLHGKLGLAKTCMTFDINLGCSGYVYGLSVIASLLRGYNRRAMLLTGDTISRIVSSKDRSTYPIFGDAGTATALEYDPSATEMVFELGTDGKGFESLMVPAGGFRTPKSEATAQVQEREGGNQRSQEHLYMRGTDIFTFTLREVPPLIHKVLSDKGVDKSEVDYFVFHQANQFMLEHLTKKMGLDSNKLVRCFDFGNTSVASIPLAMTSRLSRELSTGPLKLCLSGFGVGFSWGAAYLETEQLVMPELLKTPNPS